MRARRFARAPTAPFLGPALDRSKLLSLALAARRGLRCPGLPANLPHTLAAYQSPNGGDAIALLVNEGATEMVRVDLTAMLNPATVPATNDVCNSGTLPSSVESSISLP